MNFDDFCESLNESPWRGIFVEIGMGVPFSYEYLNRPGASSTVETIVSPYGRDSQDFLSDGVRSVSYDGAEDIIDNYHHMIAENYDGSVNDNSFVVAVTASHKNPEEQGASHGWISIFGNGKQDGVFEKDNWSFGNYGSIHFTLNKEHFRSRKDSGAFYAEVILPEFITLVLGLNDLTVSGFIKHLKSKGLGKYFRVDMLTVINDRGEDFCSGRESILELVCEGNPILISGGCQVRIEDKLRNIDSIYRGSFNPPTKSHEEIGIDSLYEISISSAWKAEPDLSDVSNRIDMLQAAGKEVLITYGAPYFVDIDGLLRSISDQNYEYKVGTDLFNGICNDKYIFGEDYLSPFYEGRSTFLVSPRDGFEVVENEYSKKITWKTWDGPTDSSMSSTRARNGELNLVSSPVRKIIEEKGLYRKV